MAKGILLQTSNLHGSYPAVYRSASFSFVSIYLYSSGHGIPGYNHVTGGWSCVRDLTEQAGKLLVSSLRIAQQDSGRIGGLLYTADERLTASRWFLQYSLS